MIKTNKTSYAILGMLSIAPMSGYEIKQTTKQSAANFWSESEIKQHCFCKFVKLFSFNSQAI